MEDLYEEDMPRDYEDCPELDGYDLDMVDDGEHEALGIEGRLAAEQALDDRDAQARRRRRRESSSPPPRNVRRRIECSPVPSEADGPEGDHDEAAPDEAYDLTHETFREDMSYIDKRLERKIQRNFQRFLCLFKQEGEREETYPDMLNKMAEDNLRHLEVSFGHLQTWSPQLAWLITEKPDLVLPLLNETLMGEAKRNFETYQCLAKRGENELRVAVHSFPVKEPIGKLVVKHKNKFICVSGVCTKRSKVGIQETMLHLLCMKCGISSGPFKVADGKDSTPNSCIQCQSKNSWRADKQKTVYRTYQEITLQATPGEVEPGFTPRFRNVIITGDQVDTVRPGHEVCITGIYKFRYDVATNIRTKFPVYKTEIECVHITRKCPVRMLQITDDPQKHLRYLATQPNIRERLISSMAPSIYGMHYVKTAILLSMMGGQMKPAARRHHYLRGDINVLIVGDPGTAKSQLLKYVEQTAPKTVYTTGKGASAVGLTAAVSRDEQGDVCLQGGAMVLADDGICLIDEFDKLGPSDRSSIHEAMEEQTISISKAGVCTTLKAKCAVIAVANPIEGRFDPERTFAQNVCFSGPILSRFDTLCVLKDEADAEQDERLADHVICSHIRCHEKATSAEKQIKPRRAQEANAIVPIEQELLQQYIVYARTSVFPKITDMNTDRIGEFYKEIREAVKGFGGAPVTSRCINSIVRLAEANARLELRQHVTSRDLDNAISTILESVIQSQNAHVAKQLRQKFSRYGKRQAEPMPQESSQPQATSQPTASQPLSTPLPTGSQAQMAPQPTVLGSRPMPEPQPIPQASSQPQAEQGECGRTKRRKTMPRRFTGGC